jgi:steroid delta-isomerase-like uncharacterized protein
MSTEDNKIQLRRFFEQAWNHKDFSVVDEMTDPTYVDHTPGGPPGVPPGPEGFKQLMSAYLAAFPNIQIAVEDVIAEGDKVVVRWTAHGTQTGPLMGIPPTGKAVTLTGITIDRLRDGKVVEGWTNLDILGMLQQLGVVPIPR